MGNTREVNGNAAILARINKGWKPNRYLTNMSMAYFADPTGFIGELTEAIAPSADEKEKEAIEQVNIPVKAEDGREMEVALVLSSVVKVFEVMQMPEEDAVKEIAGIEDENTLITIHATESRDAVKTAAKSRAVELSTGGKKKAATGGKKSTKGNAEDKAKDTAEK